MIQINSATINIPKGQYSSSLDLPVCDSSFFARNPEIPPFRESAGDSVSLASESVRCCSALLKCECRL